MIAAPPIVGLVLVGIFVFMAIIDLIRNGGR